LISGDVKVGRALAGASRDLWHQNRSLSRNLKAAALARRRLCPDHRAGGHRDDPHRRGPTQDALYNLHKSLGVLILVLMVLRLINRLVAGALAAEEKIEPWQKAASSIVHTSLYVLLLAMPVVGYIANSAYGTSTPFFGLFSIPAIIGKNEELATQLFTIHRWVGWLVILLVLTHVSAALYHHFIRGDVVLKRMLPRAMGGF
jgi:cytochrome b561